MPSSATIQNSQSHRYIQETTQLNLRALEQLEHAIMGHTDWLKKLHSGMAFSSTPSVLDTHPDAHLHCEIGHWLACHHESNLRTHPALAELQEEHRLLHQDAAAMLARFRLSGKPDIHAFSVLIGHTRRLHELLQQLRNTASQPQPIHQQAFSALSHPDLIARLQRAQARLQPGSTGASVCMLEIDQAMQLQQRLGSAALGSIVCEMLFNIQTQLRPEDWLLRKRDNALLLFLAQSSETHARSVLEHIRDTLASASMQLDSGDNLTLTVAMGAASLTVQSNPERTLFQAEQALLAAKGMGGNRVMFAVDCQDSPA